jgi:hypothetical protein
MGHVTHAARQVQVKANYDPSPREYLRSTTKTELLMWVRMGIRANSDCGCSVSRDHRPDPHAKSFTIREIIDSHSDISRKLTV